MVCLSVYYSVLDTEVCVCVCVSQCTGLQQRVCELEEAERQSTESFQEKEAELQKAEWRHQEAIEQMEQAAEAAEAQTRELALGISQAEALAQALQEQLVQAETAQRDADGKLRDLWAAVHCGLGLGGPAGPPRSQGARQRRSPSPWRSFPPAQRTHTHTHTETRRTSCVVHI